MPQRSENDSLDGGISKSCVDEGIVSAPGYTEVNMSIRLRHLLPFVTFSPVASFDGAFKTACVDSENTAPQAYAPSFVS